MACRILAPQLRMEPAPPAVEVWTLNHWTTKGVPRKVSFLYLIQTGEMTPPVDCVVYI